MYLLVVFLTKKHKNLTLTLDLWFNVCLNIGVIMLPQCFSMRVVHMYWTTGLGLNITHLALFYDSNQLWMTFIEDMRWVTSVMWHYSWLSCQTRRWSSPQVAAGNLTHWPEEGNQLIIIYISRFIITPLELIYFISFILSSLNRTLLIYKLWQSCCYIIG